MYVNIHTHNLTGSRGVIEVLNLQLTPSEIPKQPANLYTVGVHPWWSFETGVDFIVQLEKLLRHPMCMGLGEIGLDRAKGASWQHQVWCFEQQISYAALHELPLVVIHAVKAYKEVWEGIHKAQYNGAILFHDYNAELEFTKNAIKRPQTYFSYGASLFRKSSGGLTSLPAIPHQMLLLETDDQETRTIDQVYRRASEVLDLPLEKLVSIIRANASTLLRRPI